MKNVKQAQRARRINRSRAKVSGTASRPRLSVFRSNKNMFLQLIDDSRGITLASVSTDEVKVEKKTKTEIAKLAGEALAKKAAEKNIKEAVLDRRFYKYHGRVKAVAEGARAAGLKI